MTITEMKLNQRIIQTAHPEYGVWTIQTCYGDSIWVVRGRTGTICVNDAELTKFWEIA